MKLRKHKFLALTMVLCLGMVLLFENCSGGFEAMRIAGVEGQGSNTPPPSNGLTPLLRYDRFQACTAAVGYANITNCFRNNNVLPVDATQVQVDTCVTNLTAANNNVEPAPWDVANCLWKNQGWLIDQYRLAKQSDIARCANNVGADKVAACLAKNGFLPAGVDQTVIDNCIAAVTIDNVEKCLRVNEFLRANPVTTQWEINQCMKIESLATLATCMDQANILPEGVDQAQLETCNTNANGNIVRCLRNVVQAIEPVLQQVHINMCAREVRPAGIAGCLVVNGFDIEGLTQVEVDDCIAKNANLTPATVSKCLRVKEILERIVTQDDVNLCNKLAGAGNEVACLDINGLKPDSLDQAKFDMCVVAATLENARNCMRARAYIPSKFSELTVAGGFIAQKCNGCHARNNQAQNSGGYSMNTHAQWFVGGGGVNDVQVVAGNAAGSNFYVRVNNNTMPPNNGNLTDNEKAQVASWINDGARDN